MKLKVINSQARYRRFCEEEMSIPLFSQAWWLDAVAGPAAWDAVLVLRNNNIVGAHPYVMHRRRGQLWLAQPNLSQALGPWLACFDGRQTNQLAVEKDVLGALADSLPVCDGYHQNWHYLRTNWLPFYWRGYQQSTSYTYRLDVTQNEEQLWAGLQSNIRSDIRKAKKRFGVTVRAAHSVDEFLSLNRKTFERQGKLPSYSSASIEKLDADAATRKARDIFVAQDEEGKLHAGAYIIRDATTAYYLFGGGDPQLRNSGAGSLCIWEAIRSQPDHIKIFDFEGSMLEPVERYFRAFGAELVPYFRVTKAVTMLACLEECVRSLMKKQ